jgi:Mg2+ and Co2+ transporter CorA
MMTYRVFKGEKIHQRYRQFQERLRKGKANQTILADLDHEMNYLAEIDDILDELTMIKQALNNQAYVANKVLEELAEQSMQKSSSISRYYSHPHLDAFERLSDEARRVRKCVSHVLSITCTTGTVISQITTLLDLRQKEATIDEARSSAQQSTVLFIFTAVTVLFVRALIFSIY